MPSTTYQSENVPHPPVHAIIEENPVIGTLYLKDNTAFQGISFGAQRSIAGECVFQTGKNFFILLLFPFIFTNKYLYLYLSIYIFLNVLMYKFNLFIYIYFFFYLPSFFSFYNIYIYI